MWSCRVATDTTSVFSYGILHLKGISERENSLLLKIREVSKPIFEEAVQYATLLIKRGEYYAGYGILLFDIIAPLMEEDEVAFTPIYQETSELFQERLPKGIDMQAVFNALFEIDETRVKIVAESEGKEVGYGIALEKLIKRAEKTERDIESFRRFTTGYLRTVEENVVGDLAKRVAAIRESMEKFTRTAQRADRAADRFEGLDRRFYHVIGKNDFFKQDSI